MERIKESKTEENLREQNSSKRATIIRDGVAESCLQSACVVGDLVQLNTGDTIFADGILVGSSMLRCDESSMTGETDLIEKLSHQRCKLLKEKMEEEGTLSPNYQYKVPASVLVSGTVVSECESEGRMIVIAVGANSALGRIRSMIVEPNEEKGRSLLQKAFEEISEKLFNWSAICALFIIILMFTRGIWGFSRSDGSGNELILNIVESLLLGATLLFVGNPTQLTLAFSLKIASITKNMLRDSLLIRKLQVIETLGSVDIVCTDKTGLLTSSGSPTVTNFWSGKHYKLDQKTNILTEFNEQIGEIIKISLTSCYQEGGPSGTFQQIVKYMEQGCNVRPIEINEKFPAEAWFPFTSDRKMISCVRNTGKGKVIFIAGASEIVLQSCSQMLDLQSSLLSKVEMDEARIESVNETINAEGRKARRTLGFAYKEIDSLDSEDIDNKGILTIEKSGFTLLGIISLENKIIPDVPDAIERLTHAGIRVKMMTGDNKITARESAKQAGIIREGLNEAEMESVVAEGPELSRRLGLGHLAGRELERSLNTVLGNNDVYQNLMQINVLARSRPEDKYLLVKGLQARGHVVLVTGNGTNDAPSVVAADVGIGMGIDGTDITKNASGILLLDDHFATIVRAIIWGRHLHDFADKIVFYQMTSIIICLLVNCVSVVIGKRPILNSVQILWIHLVIDLLVLYSISLEYPRQDCMERRPFKLGRMIVERRMKIQVVGQIVYQFVVVLLFLFIGPMLMGDASLSREENKEKMGRVFASLFNLIVILQIFNSFNARSSTSRLSTLSIMIRTPKREFVVIFCIVFLQFLSLILGGRLFGTPPRVKSY